MANPQALYASELTWWKCQRALYYHMVEKARKPALGDELKKKLNHYARLETMAFQLLKESGWNIIAPKSFKPGVIVPKDEQELFVYRDQEGNDIVRGRIDLIACPPGDEIGGLFEVKTVNESVFNQTHSIESLIEMKHWWSGQVAQWCAYMYMSGRDYGGIIQFCRESGEIKIHYGSIIKGHKYFNEAVSEFSNTVMHNIDSAWIGAMTGVEPPFCQDLSLCSSCWCRGVVCHPPIQNAGIEMGFLGTFSKEDVARMVELEPLAKEFDKLERKIKEPLKVSIQDHGVSPEGYLIGEGAFLAKAKTKKHTSYQVPDEIKAPYRKEGIAISITIEAL